MTFSVTPLSPADLDRLAPPDRDAGLGALRTERGNLPLDRLDVQAAITGLVGRVRLTQEFVNAFDAPLEATYVFPLPDRAAVTGMTMTADGRVVDAALRERAAAREAYDRAVAEGKRASIAEEERPDVFTMRVGNILPGERVRVELRLVGPLPYEDGAATFRFPLVVAPRYIPGTPLPGPAVGDGYAGDTDAVPDASRITPPVLLPGFPAPVRLSIGVDVDPAGLTLGDVRSSLHTVVTEGSHVSVAPGERADRDFILRLGYSGGTSSAVCVADGDEGTYQVTVLPPDDVAAVRRPKDVVLVLDRSGSMGGWKMVAARRAAARIVDTLTGADRFAVLAFDNTVEYPPELGTGLVDATDRHRYRAVEHLARVDARGGTEMLAPLRDGLRLLAGSGVGADRDRVLVLVTDGQVGNEDQIVHEITPLVADVRIHAVGIDQAVNAGFLGRLATAGAGRCELVESEDRLDEAMERIHRRIGAPLVTDVTISADDMSLVDGSRAPARLPGIYPGVPLVASGRYSGAAGGALTVRGRTRDGADWSATVPVTGRDESAVTAQWARAHLRDLEDGYLVATDEESRSRLERRIVDTSLRFGVLCRFTAYVAVDSRVVTEGGTPHRVTQPVEQPAGWTMPFAPAPPVGGGGVRLMAMQRSTAGEATAAMRMPRAAGRGSAGIRPVDPAPQPLISLRQLAATEARRLREARGRPDADRREQLADLLSRLEAVLGYLASLGVPESALAPVRLLVERLRTGGDLNELWAEAVRVLEMLAATTTVLAPGPPAEPDERRRGFWKR